MKCANPACVNEFGRVGKGKWNKRFCSHSCQQAVYRHSEEYRDKVARAAVKFESKHPGARKKASQKIAKKYYVSGKLPPWMFR